MKKAAIYLRVSTTDQNYDRQKEELTVLAKSLNYDIVSVFEEKKSAVLKMDTRDQLTEMRKLTREDVERIFIWDITRLSRRSIDFINLVYEFAEKKICLHFKDSNLITLDKNDNLDTITSMYLYMLGVFAQMDAENLKAKMKSGKESALLKGNSYTNIAPFGYYLKDKHIYIKEEEAKFVRQAFELYKEGKGTQYIADIFNANNIPLKSKNKNIVWVKGTIAQILNNTVYYGKGERVSIIKATNNSPAQKTIK
ncbi:MAG: recombinase family protein [Bacteroidales bacterium]|nr:recombinase family protein [Bacteroidales bacterium]